MTDFTKDELTDLAVIVSVWCVKYIDDKRSRELSNKIDALIDNYCEHEFKCSNEAHFKCKECGVRER